MHNHNHRKVAAVSIRYFFLTILLLTLPVGMYAQHDRCGTMYADSVLRSKIPGAPTLADFENWLQQKMNQSAAAGLAARKSVITIPVIVHVIHNGDPVGTNENISQAQVMSQLEVLNEDFRRLNADTVNTPAAFRPVAADVEIEFCPALVDPDGNLLAEPGIHRVNMGQATWSSTTDIDNNLKPATIWDPTRYFNIWTVNFGSGSSLLGYAQFPEGSGLAGMPAGAQNALTDGIVCRYDAFGRVGNVTAPYNRGRTATHETGHWLGLRHIWGDGGCGTDDYCSDTPESDASNSGCDPSHVSCGTVDMVQNYMDYSNDACMNLFTLCQKTRMLTVMQNSPRRMELISSIVCQQFNRYNIIGQVQDATNNLGVTQAKVRLTNSAFNYEAQTDVNGNFVITNVFEGTYTLYAGKWSYITASIQTVQVDSSTAPLIIQLDKGYYDDFVLDYSWTVSGTASTGQWERGVPVGTLFNGVPSNPGADVSNDFGNECFVTGNGGGAAGNDDVDDGNTILTSPVFDLSGYHDPYVHFYRWFYNAGGSGNPNDTLYIRLYNGITSAILETVTPSTANPNQWNFRNFRIRDFLTPTSAMMLLLETADRTGSGHIVEAAFDLFRVVDSLPDLRAQFTASQNTGCPGTSITFTSQSTGNIVSYQWYFPGGIPSSSSDMNPAVSYAAAGSYSVTLIVQDNTRADTLTRINFISIQNYIPNFSADIRQGCPGLIIRFADQTTCTPTSYAWSFPGGNPATASTPNPVVEYPFEGTFDVTLSITTPNGLQSITKPGFVTITSGLPVTVFSEDFESGSLNTQGWTLTNPDSGITWSLTTVGGSTSGNTAAGIQLFSYSAIGQRDGLISPPLNLSRIANTTLTFDHAYRRSSTAIRDSLIIYVSTDDGLTFPFKVFAAAETGAGTFATNTTTTTSFIPATADDWCFSGGIGAPCFTVDLSAFDGYADVKLKFESYNNQCNNLYLDNILVSGICTSPLPKPIAAFTQNISAGCAPLSVTFTDSSENNPVQWQWSFPGGTPSFSSVPAPQVVYPAPGVYPVTLIVSNASGSDTLIRNAWITVFAKPSIDSIQTTDPSCFGASDGEAQAWISGGTPPYSYYWSNGQGSPTAVTLSAGNYGVTVQDSNQCSATALFSLQTPADLSLSFTTFPAYCGNASGSVITSVSGGTPPYTYVWSNGADSSVLSHLAAGSYTLTVTDKKGCAKVATATIAHINSSLQIGFTILPVSCFGSHNGAIDVEVAGGFPPYDYFWSDGSLSQDVSGVAAGIYTLEVTDSAGCQFTDTFTIPEPPPLGLHIITEEDSCGTILVEAIAVVSGGTPPYSFLWSNNSTSSTVTNLNKGSHAVTVTDANGCSVSQSIIVDAGPGVSISSFSVTPDSAGLATGSISVTVTGGSPPYAFLWSNGATTPALHNLFAGDYLLTVTDVNGCSATASFSVSYVPDNTVGISHLFSDNLVFSVFPNPSSGKVYISLHIPQQNQLLITFYEQTGRQLSSETIHLPAGQHTLPLPDVPTGLYLLKIKTQAFTAVTRIVVIR
ncbi:MAG: hypothetical protein KatS3mg031_2705 [Chitinophagales bacterium]|nr:MAG: hypothetical protein KatS3mg031_2705 [Chitinophagales bacterium]